MQTPLGVLIAVALSFVAAVPLKAQGTSVQQIKILRSDYCGAWEPECSTPAGHIEAQEVSRDKIRGETRVGYRIKASGFPPTQSLDLEYRLGLVGDSALVSSGYMVDTTGGVVCGGAPARSAAMPGPSCTETGSQELDSLTLMFHPLYAGWPVLIGLLSPDREVRVYAKVVPFPVQAVDGTCRIDVQFFSRQGLRIRGTGFQPGETVLGTSEVEGEARVDTLTAGADGSVPGPGKVLIVLVQADAGKGGEAHYQLAGPRCRPSVSYKWGSKQKAQ